MGDVPKEGLALSCLKNWRDDYYDLDIKIHTGLVQTLTLLALCSLTHDAIHNNSAESIVEFSMRNTIRIFVLY